MSHLKNTKLTKAMTKQWPREWLCQKKNISKILIVIYCHCFEKTLPPSSDCCQQTDIRWWLLPLVSIRIIDEGGEFNMVIQNLTMMKFQRCFWYRGNAAAVDNETWYTPKVPLTPFHFAFTHISCNSYPSPERSTNFFGGISARIFETPPQ